MIILKAVITAFVVVSLSELAKRFTLLSGILAAMPITTLMVLLLVYFDTGDRALVLRFSKAVIYALAPTALFFAVFVFMMERGYSFAISLAASFLSWGIAAFFLFRFVRL
ncbi:MAG: DUF3147 family protein [Deferribacteres bacterium]|nr:DUF3147 family protein [Deferribacteres bacterium]